MCRGPWPKLNPFDPTFPAAPRATCREAPHRPELHRSALAVRRALSAAPARSLRTSRQRVSQRVEHLANLQQGAANGARPVLETSPLNIGARKQRSHVDHAHWLRRSARPGTTARPGRHRPNPPRGRRWLPVTPYARTRPNSPGSARARRARRPVAGSEEVVGGADRDGGEPRHLGRRAVAVDGALGARRRACEAKGRHVDRRARRL